MLVVVFPLHRILRQHRSSRSLQATICFWNYSCTTYKWFSFIHNKQKGNCARVILGMFTLVRAGWVLTQLRFLYLIYPLICVAAAAVIESFPDFFYDRYSSEQSFLYKIAKFTRPLFIGLILCVSHSRTFSIVNGYGAPLEIYKHFEHHDDAGTGAVVCVGSEWHRFPSSFFIPDYVGEVRWIDDGFRGLLPFPFNSTVGGTSAAPPYFNNKNKASPDQFLQDVEKCDFLVELQLQRPFLSRGSDLSKWEVVAALPYLDREFSPPLHRSFFIPFMWEEKNVFGMYKLLKRHKEQQ